MTNNRAWMGMPMIDREQGAGRSIPSQCDSLCRIAWMLATVGVCRRRT
jgi:hypothetical protein